jgi:hypothetical protein
VTSTEFTSAQCWGGRAIAKTIAEAVPRQRVVVTGTIQTATTIPLGSGIAYACVLTDGTGQLGLVFLGRRDVPGLVPRARCTVEGTARMMEGSLVVWNPQYRFETDAPL